RAGERGALDAGALPTLLPGGRPVADDGARAEVERVWDAHIPATAGRDLAGILANAGEHGALLIGGVELSDLPDQAAAEAALRSAGFVVSLELRRSAITQHADVVFPVAAAAEKAGRYVTWEGRRRPFDLTLTGTGQLSDGRVLHALADELDLDLGLPSHTSARAELDQLGVATARVSAPELNAYRAEPSGDGLVLATWHELIDAGSMSDGEPNLAGTAKPLRVAMAKQTATDLGVGEGDLVTVSLPGSAPGRSLSAPVELRDEVATGTVWLPTNHRDGSVRAVLGGSHGDPVTVSRNDASARSDAGRNDATGGTA
ncbi:MAG: molybdopterin-dependent oxidoreductase, partial [Actinomycetota bacterium]|nr:molybdopterin-dependent oxidoreductase [Actinomycetota bacterium]